MMIGRHPRERLGIPQQMIRSNQIFQALGMPPNVAMMVQVKLLQIIHQILENYEPPLQELDAGGPEENLKSLPESTWNSCRPTTQSVWRTPAIVKLYCVTMAVYTHTQSLSM